MDASNLYFWVIAAKDRSGNFRGLEKVFNQAYYLSIEEARAAHKKLSDIERNASGVFEIRLDSVRELLEPTSFSKIPNGERDLMFWAEKHHEHCSVGESGRCMYCLLYKRAVGLTTLLSEFIDGLVEDSALGTKRFEDTQQKLSALLSSGTEK
jgi:hypothetical protein